MRHRTNPAGERSGPNLDPSTSATEALLPPRPSDEPQIASDSDPNEEPSTAAEEAALPPTPPSEAQTASDPDPNVAPSISDDKDDEVSARSASASSGSRSRTRDWGLEDRRIPTLGCPAIRRGRTGDRRCPARSSKAFDVGSTRVFASRLD